MIIQGQVAKNKEQNSKQTKMAKKPQVNSQMFIEFNNLQKEIFKKVFAASMKQTEAKTELVNPKSPKIARLSQSARNSASPQTKPSSSQPKPSSSQPKPANSQQKPKKQPQNGQIQPKPASGQQPSTSAQSSNSPKFEFVKIQPQSSIQPVISPKILNKVTPAPPTIKINDLIINNNFLYPEISILTVDSPQNQAKAQEASQVVNPSVQDVIQPPKIQPDMLQVIKEQFMTLYKTNPNQKTVIKSSPTQKIVIKSGGTLKPGIKLIPTLKAVNKSSPAQKPAIMSIPAQQTEIGSRLTQNAIISSSPTQKTTIKSIQTLKTTIKSAPPQSPPMELPTTSSASSPPATPPKDDQDIFKVPEVPKRSIRLLPVQKKKQKSPRRKSDPQPPKQPKAAAPKRNSLGNAKPQKAPKKSKTKENVYEMPRKSFSVPSTSNESSRGLRRGRSRGNVCRQRVPDKPMKEMTQDEFLMIFDVMKKVEKAE